MRPLTFEERYSFGTRELERLASQLYLPNNIKAEVGHKFYKLLEGNMTQGRATEVTLGCLIYHYCKAYGYPLEMRDIAGVLGADKWRMFKSYTRMQRRLGLGYVPVDAGSLIPKYVEMLELPYSVVAEAARNLKKVEKTGCTPRTKAITSIYLTGKVTLAELKRKCNVSEMGVRGCMGKLKQ